MLRNLAVFAKAVEKAVSDEAKRLHAESEALRRPRPQPVVGTIDDLLAMDEEPCRIEGLLPTEGRLLLSAQKKVGKTTMVGNLAHSLITGEPFLGRFATRAIEGRVVALNYEVTGRQFASWMRDIGIPSDRMVVVNLRGRENLLASEAGREHLVERIREVEGQVLIVDPFGRAFTGEDQNSASAVGPWLGILDEVAEASGCTEMILVAHTGWNGERSRGSSALEDWPDSILRLTKDGDGASAPRFVSAEGRDVDVDEDRLDFDKATRRLTMSGAGGRRKAKGAEKAEELRSLVLMAVAERPDSYVGQVENWLTDRGYSKGRSGSVARVLRECHSEGRLAMREGENNRRHYSLAGLVADERPSSDPEYDAEVPF